MNIIALLAWYQEDPAWLNRTLRSLERIGVHHIVALDGAYAAFPHARNRSGIAQHEAIVRAAYAIGAGLTIHIAAQPWASEIDKRTALFQHAEHVATPNEDWYLIVDADEHITNAPPDIHERLRTSVFDVADVTFHEPQIGAPTRRYPIPILFRAIPGLHVHTNHYTYVTPDGRKLWGNATTDRLAPRLQLHDLELEHLTHFRDHRRRDDARAYYQARDQAGLEAGHCVRCPATATRQVPWRWRQVDDGYAADWTEACDTHAAEILQENRARLRAWGIQDQPHQVRIGPAPIAA